MSATRQQDGFTLVEVLVAMVAGLIVISALFAILEVSLRQTSHLTDRVQATQLGEAAMTRIVDALHSGCIAYEATPVQESSGPTKLVFITGYSEKSIPTSSEVYKETVEWKSTGTSGEGKLWALTQKASAGTYPTFTSWEAGSSTLLAENIYEHEVEEGGTKHRYVFHYYKYNTTTSSSSSSGLSALTPLSPSETTGLTAAEAKTAAGVEVAFTAAPADNNLKLTRSTEFANQVTFAFAAPSSESTIKDAPCE